MQAGLGRGKLICRGMKVCLIQPKARRRPMDTELKARMSPHLGLLSYWADRCLSPLPMLMCDL